MGQGQLLLAAVLIIGVVSYIVVSSQPHSTARATLLPSPKPPISLPQRPKSRPPAAPLQTRKIRVPQTTSARVAAPQTVPQVFTGTSASTMILAEQREYRSLLAKAHGGRALVERLIAYEQKRERHGTRLIWIQNANARWERDNR